MFLLSLKPFAFQTAMLLGCILCLPSYILMKWSIGTIAHDKRCFGISINVLNHTFFYWCGMGRYIKSLVSSNVVFNQHFYKGSLAYIIVMSVKGETQLLTLVKDWGFKSIKFAKWKWKWLVFKFQGCLILNHKIRLNETNIRQNSVLDFWRKRS